METLSVVIQEANKDVAYLKDKWKTDDDVLSHYKPFYERVKTQCNSLNFFVTICIEDFKMNLEGMSLIGGVIVSKDKD